MLGFSFHTHPVAFSPDSRLLAYATPIDRKGATALGPDFEHEADAIVVVDITRKEQVACLTQDSDFLYALAFSPCGNFLTSGGSHDTLQEWNVATWQLHKQKQVENGHQIVPAYTPEGNLRCVSLDDATITVWNIEQDEKVDTYDTSAKKWDAHIFTGTHFVMATAHDLNVWTLAPSHLHTVRNTHTDFVKSLTFAADGKTLVSGYGYNHTLCWQVAEPSQLPTVFMPPGRKHRVYTSSTGKPYVTNVEENTINVWEFGNEIPIAQCKVKESPLYEAIAFSSKTQLLAYADLSGNVFLWDAACQELYATLTGHTELVLLLAFSPDGKYLASTCKQTVGFRLWDIERTAELQAFPGDDIETLAFSPCGNLVAGDTRKEIRLWDITHRDIYCVMPKLEEWKADGYWQLALAFSPCGQYLAAGADRTLSMERVPVRLWNVTTGTEIATFRGHFEAVQSLAFSPDGTLLASGGSDGILFLWDLKPYLS